jgi:hypothetical protein
MGAFSATAPHEKKKTNEISKRLLLLTQAGDLHTDRISTHPKKRNDLRNVRRQKPVRAAKVRRRRSRFFAVVFFS